MRSSDIVNQLSKVLPTIVDDFTTNICVSSLIGVGTTVTVTTSTAHGLVVGSKVNICGALTPIIISSLTRDGLLGTLVTDTVNDLTSGSGSVLIDGANEPEFNGVFEIQNNDGELTVNFKMPDSGPTVATGSPVLLNGFSLFQSFNGLHAVSNVVSPTVFEYELPFTLDAVAAGNITVKSNPRISHALTPERAEASYTEQGSHDAWAFVVMGDALADKNRAIDTDATDNVQPTSSRLQRLIQAVQVLVFLPTSSEIGGGDSGDRAQELFQPISQSLAAFKPDSLISTNNNTLQWESHNLLAYNAAYYIHQYVFSATLQLTESDTFIDDDSVKFRQIQLGLTTNLGAGELSATINL